MSDINKVMGEISLLSPSSSTRWLSCTGSIFLPQIQKSQSDAAKLGTLKHTLIHDFFIEHGLDTTVSIRKYMVGVILKNPDLDLTDHDVVLAEEYMKFVSSFGFDSYFIEKKIRVKTLGDLCYGTPDFVGVRGRELHVIDLKTGKGDQISPVNNYQLFMYALGYFDPKTIDSIHFHIVQPDMEDNVKLKSWDLDEEFWDFMMGEISNFLFEIKNGKGVLREGDWCKYCNSILICPIYTKIIDGLGKYNEIKKYDQSIDELEDIYSRSLKLKFLFDYAKSTLTSRLVSGEKGKTTYIVYKQSSRKLDPTAVRECLSAKGIVLPLELENNLTISSLKKILSDEEITNVSKVTSVPELKLKELNSGNPYKLRD